MVPVDLTLQTKIQTTFDNTYKDLSYFTLEKSIVESLAGKSATFKAKVTNFLGNYNENSTTITFSASKRIGILDLPDVVTF